MYTVQYVHKIRNNLQYRYVLKVEIIYSNNCTFPISQKRVYNLTPCALKFAYKYYKSSK